MTQQRALVISVLPRTNVNQSIFFPQVLNSLGSRRHYTYCISGLSLTRWHPEADRWRLRKIQCTILKQWFFSLRWHCRTFASFTMGYHIVLVPGRTGLIFCSGQDGHGQHMDAILYHFHWEWRERDSKNSVKSRMFIQFKSTLCVAPIKHLDLS